MQNNARNRKMISDLNEFLVLTKASTRETVAMVLCSTQKQINFHWSAKKVMKSVKSKPG